MLSLASTQPLHSNLDHYFTEGEIEFLHYDCVLEFEPWIESEAARLNDLHARDKFLGVVNI